MSDVRRDARLGVLGLLLGLVLAVGGRTWAAAGPGGDANIGAGLTGLLGIGLFLCGAALLIRAAVNRGRA